MRRSQNATASSRPSRCRRESWCTCSERTPGVISMIPGSFSSRNCCSNPCTRKRRFRSSAFGPYSTSKYLSPSARQTTAGAPSDSNRRRTASSRKGVSGSDAVSPESVSMFISCPRLNSNARSNDSARNRTMSPAFSCPIFQSSASTMVAGHTKPPRLGPSGPRITGISPVKSMVPTA